MFNNILTDTTYVWSYKEIIKIIYYVNIPCVPPRTSFVRLFFFYFITIKSFIDIFLKMWKRIKKKESGEEEGCLWAVIKDNTYFTVGIFGWLE